MTDGQKSKMLVVMKYLSIFIAGMLVSFLIMYQLFSSSPAFDTLQGLFSRGERSFGMPSSGGAFDQQSSAAKGINSFKSDAPLTCRPNGKSSFHVLVTGGAGFIGSHATKLLLETGHCVTIIDNLSRGNSGAAAVLRSIARPGQLRVVWGDLSDPAILSLAFGGHDVDVVMHFAAVAFVGESVAHPLQYYHNITSNTVSLLEAIQAHDVKRLVYSSTCAVYGNSDVMPITEETPTRPVNPYGRAKLHAEEVIRDLAKSRPTLQTVILRYFNVYGADPQGQLGEFPPPELVSQGRISSSCFAAALGDIEEVVVYGTDFKTRDGTCIRDYIHVNDLVRAHMLAMPVAANPPALFNLGTGKGVSVREFVGACKRVIEGGDGDYKVNVRERESSRPGDYAEVYADPRKANQLLNWTARYTDVEEGLSMAWRWRKAHPKGYKGSPAQSLRSGSR